MIRRSTLCASLTILLLLVAQPLLAQQQAKQEKVEKPEPSVGMKIKLDLSKDLLAALAQGDFEAIAKNSEAMQGLNIVEYFVRGNKPAYRAHLRVFQLANKDLTEHAKAKNLDGATLAFTQMTISCVNCHKEVRKQ